MDGNRKITSRDVADLIIALAPVVAFIAMQHRDELTQARMWLERKLAGRGDDGGPLRQVQKEISLMEHGDYGGADAS